MSTKGAPRGKIYRLAGQQTWAVMRPWSVVAMAVFVTVPLVYFGARPVRLAEIAILPHSERQAQVLTKQITARVSRAGPVYFDFHASVADKLIKTVILEVRPDESPVFFPQPDAYDVDQGQVLGLAQLGSPDYPVREGGSSTFRLLDDSGRQILDGKIILVVHAVAGGPSWLVVFVGALAAFLQLLSMVVPRATTDA